MTMIRASLLSAGDGHELLAGDRKLVEAGVEIEVHAHLGKRRRRAGAPAASTIETITCRHRLQK
jgi:hypothetical protein